MNKPKDWRSRVFGTVAGLMVALGVSPAHGQHGGGGHGGGHGGSLASARYGPVYGPGPTHMPHNGGGWGGGGYGGYGVSPYVFGLGGVFLPAFYTPVPVPVPVAPFPTGGGLMLPNPAVPQPGALPAARMVARPDPARSDTYLTLGDNLFRAGNRHRAEQRYLQAVRANPQSAKPRVRLAQLALVRGDYSEAAEHFRAATTAEPGWLINAADVQALFAEPGDFARALAQLETHLQSAPTDRDGWLVLGAEWYLSGRTRQAADVFARLSDRRPDATLAAFLNATTPDAMARGQR